jgi:hypothetical protein
MVMPRETLRQHLNALEARLPEMVRTLPAPQDFWPEFAGQADVIVEAAGEDDCDWVHERMDEMLLEHGAPVFD